MGDPLDVAKAAVQGVEQAMEQADAAAPAPSPAGDFLTDPKLVNPRVKNFCGAYNRCQKCGLVSLEAKYCPFCGTEMEHVPPSRRCSSCKEQVAFEGAKYCAWCGKPLE